MAVSGSHFLPGELQYLLLALQEGHITKVAGLV